MAGGSASQQYKKFCKYRAAFDNTEAQDEREADEPEKDGDGGPSVGEKRKRKSPLTMETAQKKLENMKGGEGDIAETFDNLAAMGNFIARELTTIKRVWTRNGPTEPAYEKLASLFDFVVDWKNCLRSELSVPMSKLIDAEERKLLEQAAEDTDTDDEGVQAEEQEIVQAQVIGQAEEQEGVQAQVIGQAEEQEQAVVPAPPIMQEQAVAPAMVFIDLSED